MFIQNSASFDFVTIIIRIFYLFLLCPTFLILSNAQDFGGEQSPYSPDMLKEMQDMNLTDSLTTADSIGEKASLSQKIINDALNLDIGKYTPQTYEYYNKQNEQLAWKRTTYYESRCYDDYVKCLISQTNLFQICAYSYDIAFMKNAMEFASYCDLYMDNCRRRTRFWVGYKKGPCEWYDPNYVRIDDRVSGK